MNRKLALLLVLSVAAPAVASAQYFGQNKVQYRTFEFQIIQTEHFDVYFYPREREAAMDAARMAERSYARLSRVLNHEFHERKPIILYDVASVGAQAYVKVAAELMQRTGRTAGGAVVAATGGR